MEAAAQGQTNGLGTGAMVTGIVALVLALVPGIGIVSLVAGPVAAILGFVAMRRPGVPVRQARIGFVTGILATLVAIAWMVYFGNRAAADRAAVAANEVTAEWLTGAWSAQRGNCPVADTTTLKADGTYTAPSNMPGRHAIGIWSVEDRVLSMGTIFQEDRFRIRRLGNDELQRQAENGGAATTLYRC